MAYNIGLDFGTTYSIISELKNVKKDKNGNIINYELEGFSPTENGTPAQDSIVLKDADGVLSFGKMTRSSSGRRGTTTYKGFKMMLAEKNPEILTARGYDDVYTPEHITRSYLGNVLKNYATANGLNDAPIDKVVIGVPEIWFDETTTIDCRKMLKDTVLSLGCVKEVELISEPAAACAFCVEKYKEVNGKPYVGKILVIDYGGGTLDISLCDVKAKGMFSEVTVIKRCGAGINEEGKIGKAGMAFLEEIVVIALNEAGINDTDIKNHRDYYRCVHQIEDFLMANTDELKDMLVTDVLIDITTLSGKIADIDFDYEPIPVTAGILAKAYNNVIRDVLEKSLNEIITFMTENNIEFDAMHGNEFKIVPVGGFCNFCLTRHQIDEAFMGGVGDTRFIFEKQRDCEKAISYGATLVANGIIGFRRLAPYSIGIATQTGGAYYIINRGDEIVYDRPVFIKTENSDEDRIFFISKIPMLAFNGKDPSNDKYTRCGVPPEEYAKKLVFDSTKCCKLGFSLDHDLIITLHQVFVDPEDHKTELGHKQVVLDDITAMFGGFVNVD